MDGTLRESSSTIDWLPFDLGVSAAFAITVGALVLVAGSSASVTLLWVAFAAFVPGYVLVCAAFPHERDGERRARVPGPRTWVERTVLSIGTSIGLFGVIALVARATALPGRTTAVVSLTVVTVVAAGLAALRRESIAAGDRFDPDLFGRLSSLQDRIFDFEGRAELSGIILTVVVLALATAGAAYAMAPPDDQPGETTLYLLTDDETTAASDYPDTLEVGEEESVIVGIENQEGEPMPYTVVVQLQTVETTDSGPAVESAVELDRFRIDVTDGESVERERSITATQSGEEFRLAFLLYTDDPPESPDTENAYRSTYLWTDVEE